MARPLSLLPLALVALGAVGGLGASCDRARGTTLTALTHDAAVEHAAAPSLRVYFLVDLDGYLEPCGCQQHPLGGIDRIAHVIEQERPNAPPSMLVAAGNLFFLEPHLDARMIYQERAKAESLTQILPTLNLAAFAPGPADFALGAEAWARLSSGVRAPALAANAGMQASRVVDVGGVKVGVVGVSDFAPATGAAAAGAPTATDPVEAARAAVAAARAQGAAVIVVLASVPRRAARAIASSVDGVDFVVAAREEGTLSPPPERIGGAFLLTAPNQGKHLGVLDLFVNGAGAFRDASDATANAARVRLDTRIADLRVRIEAWSHDPATDATALATQRQRLAALERERAEHAVAAVPATGRFFRERSIEVSDEVPKLPAVEARIAAYFHDVNEHNRLEYASLRAPAPARNTPYYVGAETCRDCHEESYAVWQGTPHSHAYRTIEEVSKNFNLSCVGCHVTGYRQPGGSEVVQNDGLRDVQCESCHGPGSQHLSAHTPVTRRATIRRQVSAEFCATQCHTPEHSDHFDYASYLPRILGPGHGRPLAASDAGTAPVAASDASVAVPLAAAHR